jgi:hypothetical protein
MQRFRFYPVVTWFVLSVVSFGYAQEEVLILRRVAREFRPKGEEQSRKLSRRCTYGGG